MALKFITGNKNKLAEVQAVLPNIEQLDIDLVEIQDIDPHSIIAAKLKEALNHHDGEFIVEDTSLYLDGINGLPGPFIKWFLQKLDTEGIATLAQNSGNTRASAKVIIGYAKNKDDIKFFEGSILGNIVSPRGETTFGWDPVFQPDGYEKTFAEMTSQEKNQISMRRIAIEKLKEYLTQTNT
ncbi:non-canonical purine NTP pyrophosphatase [bacterium]|nr:MAG: non-canonical purine NTP pyrophosphatase [bacterium]